MMNTVRRSGPPSTKDPPRGGVRTAYAMPIDTVPFKVRTFVAGLALTVANPMPDTGLATSWTRYVCPAVACSEMVPAVVGSRTTVDSSPPSTTSICFPGQGLRIRIVAGEPEGIPTLGRTPPCTWIDTRALFLTYTVASASHPDGSAG